MKFVPVPDTSVLFCIHEVRYKDYAAYAADSRPTSSRGAERHGKMAHGVGGGVAGGVCEGGHCAV